MKGKALFPTFTYKNLTFHYNFGPEPMVPLPFKCRTIQSAAAADVAKAKVLAMRDVGNYTNGAIKRRLQDHIKAHAQ